MIGDKCHFYALSVAYSTIKFTLNLPKINKFKLESTRLRGRSTYLYSSL